MLRQVQQHARWGEKQHDSWLRSILDELRSRANQGRYGPVLWATSTLCCVVAALGFFLHAANAIHVAHCDWGGAGVHAFAECALPRPHLCQAPLCGAPAHSPLFGMPCYVRLWCPLRTSLWCLRHPMGLCTVHQSSRLHAGGALLAAPTECYYFVLSSFESLSRNPKVALLISSPCPWPAGTGRGLPAAAAAVRLAAMTHSGLVAPAQQFSSSGSPKP